MPDTIEDWGGGQHFLSTSETFTGEYWINGKKIYRKIFERSNFHISAHTWTSFGQLDTLFPDGRPEHIISGCILYDPNCSRMHVLNGAKVDNDLLEFWIQSEIAPSQMLFIFTYVR